MNPASHIARSLIILGISLMTITGSVKSQTSPIMQPVQKSVDWSQQVILTDNLGRPIKNIYDNVQGSAFFEDKPKYAFIRMLGGRNGFLHVPARLNLYTHEIHFINASNAEMVLPFGTVLEAEFVDTPSTGTPVATIFRTGFPAIDQQNEYHFYQVLAEGRATLLKFIKRKINDERNELSGEVKRQFDNYEDYYIFRDRKMYRLKREKTSFLDVFADKRSDIDNYLKKDPVNFRKQEDLVRLIAFYNSL